VPGATNETGARSDERNEVPGATNEKVTQNDERKRARHDDRNAARSNKQEGARNGKGCESALGARRHRTGRRGNHHGAEHARYDAPDGPVRLQQVKASRLHRIWPRTKLFDRMSP
jgi:hypothetical protein